MKTLFAKVQATFKALQLLSEPEMLHKLYAEVNTNKRKSNMGSGNGQFIFHKHFIVQVMN